MEWTASLLSPGCPAIPLCCCDARTPFGCAWPSAQPTMEFAPPGAVKHFSTLASARQGMAIYRLAEYFLTHG
jgi:hypothetical protein